ncbi:MAG: autotransporter domain-containing protein [Gammaproteobacteria bacterium]|nr:autotransporter domain-containing protein [Gammaproteobacteria bacterium]
MSYPNLTHSLLALAIAGASIHASAATIDVSNGPILYETETITGPLTVTGSYGGDAAKGTGDVFEIEDSTLNGSLILDAAITTKGGLYTNDSSQDLEYRNGEAVSIDDSHVKGSVTNKGNLEITSGFQSEVFELDDSIVDGDLINEGRITASGSALAEGELGKNDSGFPINVFNEQRSGLVLGGTSIGGNLINSGEIKSSITGTQMPEGTTDLYGISIDGSTIKGNVINSGNITVAGNSAGNSSTGIMIKQDVYNDWDPVKKEYVLTFERTAIEGQIKNTGTIQVTGNTDAVGVRFDDGFTVKGGLHNTGTIHGDNVGIKMEGTDTTLNITQAGGKVSGGDYAINQGSNTANLTLAGGEIDGNLNVNNIDVVGSGKITANTVDTKQLTVKNNGKLDLTGNTIIDLNTNLTLAGGEVSGKKINVNGTENKIEVTGNSKITADTVKIESFQLSIKNGSQLSLAGNAGTIYLDTDINLGDGEIHGDFKTNDIDVTGNSKLSANNVQAKYLEVHSGGQLNLGGVSGAITLSIADPADPSNGFVVKKGGVLGLKLSGDYGDAGQPLVTVNGDLSFDSGSTVSLSAVKGFTLEGQDYFLIGAESITGDKEGLVKGSALLKVNSYEIADDKNLFANVSIVSGGDFSNTVAATGGTGNAQAAAAQVPGLLASLSNSKNASFQAFANDLAQLESGEAARAAEQMTPDVDGGAVAVANQGLALISGVTSSRTAAIRGQSSGAALSETGVWVQGLYSDARQGTRNDIAGYNAYTSGMAIGADAKVTDNLTVGAAYGYMDSTVNSKRGNTTEVDGHSLTVYAGYELGNYFVDSSLIYSKNENESKRHILNTTAKGSYDSDTLGLSVLGGYDFQMDNMTVSPLVGMNYSNTKLDGYTEKGSAAALRNGSQRYEVAELGTGARLSASYPLGQGRLEPQVQVMVFHDFAADSAKSTSTFVNAVGGNSFVAYGAKPERTSYQTNVGADYKIGAFTVGGSYGYTGKKGFNSDTFAAKVRYDF